MDTFNKYFKIARKCYTEELTINQYFKNLKTIQDAETEIKTELKSKTVKILKSVNAQLGNFTDSRHKKQDLINKAFDSLESYFLIGRSVSYFLGEGTHQSAQNKLIQSTTAQDLETFYNKRRQEKAEKQKALNNPETLSDFRTFIQTKGKNELTAKQLAKFEELTADVTLKRQAREEEQKNTVNKINIENVEFILHPTEQQNSSKKPKKA